MPRTFAFVAALAAVALTSLPAAAGKFNKKLSIGDAAPVWKNAVGTDDKTYGLDDFKDAKVIVTVFTCNHCPVAKSYEDRLIALQKDYQDKGVQVVAISVSHEDEDKPAEMKLHAKEKGYNFPYLHDASQESARSYGASTTPEVVVLDKDRKVVYLGVIDDKWSDEPTKHYVRDAIDATLAGKRPERAETKPYGCGIQYE